MGDRYLLTFSTKFKSDSNLVNIKKGNNAGTIFVAHTIKPFKQACRFSVGESINKKINAITSIDKKILCFLDKFKFYYP